MANWRPVDVRLWNDRKFLACSDRGRLLWLFLLTCPSLPIPGVVIGGDGALAEMLGWTVEGLREGFIELERNGLRVRREARIAWLPNALKYQPCAGPNAIKCWGGKWDDVPEGDLKGELWEAMRIACKSWSILFSKLFPKPFVEPIRDPLANPSRRGSTHDHQHDHQNQHDHDLEDQSSPSARAIPHVVQEQQQPAGGAGPAAEPPGHALAGDQFEASKTTAPSRVSGTWTDQQAISSPAITAQARDLEPAAAPPSAVGDRDVKPAKVPPHGESAWHRRMRWWGAMLEADARIRAAGIEPNAPTLPKNMAGENERNLAACERQLVDAGFTPDEVDAKMLHVVAVAEAEALRPDNRSRKWFKPALIWDPGRANRAVDTSVDEAKRARPAPGQRIAAPPPTPTKRVEPRPPDPVRSPEDIAAMLAQAEAVAAAPERGREIAALPTAELVKRFGGDSARAPPASTGPGPDPDDNERKPRKATTA